MVSIHSFQLELLQELIRRSDSERERLRSAPGSYPNSMKWRKITPLRRSRSFKATDFGTNRKLIYDFLLVINTNLPRILHRFRYVAVDRSKIAIFYYPSCVKLLPAAGFPWDDLREIFSGCQPMTKVYLRP